MADNHRNQGKDYRSSSQDWNNENNGNNQGRSWEDRNSGNYGSQGYEDSGYGGSGSRYNKQQDEGNFNRWNRESDQNQEYGSGRYNREYKSGNSNYGNQDENYGYGGREYGSNYGGGGYQGNSSYYSNQSAGSGKPSYGSSRNLYDRDYEGQNRQSNRGSNQRIGGSNYGENENRGGRNYDEGRSWGYSGSNYGGNFYGGNQRGGHNREDSNDRSWWDRTKDEVTSWFGDDDAERRRERDRQQNYRGKGPRNYTRSDDRIKEDINDRLSDDPWVDASDIDVTVSKGEVTLTGNVADRNSKRRAEDLAEQISGVKHVENRIRVGRSEGSNIGTGTSIGTGMGASSGMGSTAGSSSGVAGVSGSTGSEAYVTQSALGGTTSKESEKSKR